MCTGVHTDANRQYTCNHGSKCNNEPVSNQNIVADDVLVHATTKGTCTSIKCFVECSFTGVCPKIS